MNKTSSTEPRDTKTLTVRMDPALHEQAEKAAAAVGQSLNVFIAGATRAAVSGEHVSSAPEAVLAVLVDADDFAGGDAINVDAIERLAALYGHVGPRSSYYTRQTSKLDTTLGQLEGRYYRPTPLASRDAVRLQLTIDACSMWNRGGLSGFVLVTADEQLGLVAARLTDLGAKVVGVKVRPADAHTEATQGFSRAFAEFWYYDRLATPPESEALAKLRSNYVDCLLQLVLRYESRGAKAVLAALIPAVKDRFPDASPALLEFRNWPELAELASSKGWVTLGRSGNDYLLTLSEAGRARAEHLLADSDAATVRSDEIERVRTVVEGLVGVELPDEATRFLIFSTLQWVLGSLQAADGVPLVALSWQVTERLRATGIPQNTVYRLLNGLYRGGAFDVRTNLDNDNDPVVLRARVPHFQFDNAFIVNLMRISLKRAATVLDSPKALAQVFYGQADQDARILPLLKIATSPDFERSRIGAMLAKLERSPT